MNSISGFLTSSEKENGPVDIERYGVVEFSVVPTVLLLITVGIKPEQDVVTLTQIPLKRRKALGEVGGFEVDGVRPSIEDRNYG